VDNYYLVTGEKSVPRNQEWLANEDKLHRHCDMCQDYGEVWVYTYYYYPPTDIESRWAGLIPSRAVTFIRCPMCGGIQRRKPEMFDVYRLEAPHIRGRVIGWGPRG
jgi:hypothetical protein